MKAALRPDAADHHVSSGLRLELADLLGIDLPDHGGVPPARSSVLENTIFGISRQRRANAATRGVMV